MKNRTMDNVQKSITLSRMGLAEVSIGFCTPAMHIIH
jgi:hypothetical protein